MSRDGSVWYYGYDGHEDTRLLTDEEGAVTDTYSYDAWGNQLTKTGSTDNSYLYTGECLDAFTGLYYLRARYMNPATGLFISMDSYQGSLYDPTSLHKYLYANANPVMNTDPTGYFSIMEFEAAQTIEKILQAAYPTCFYKVMMMLEVASTCYSTTRQAVTSLLEGAKLGDVIGQWLGGMLFGIFLEALMGVACNVPKALIIALSIGSSYLSIKQIIAYIKSGDYDLAIAEAINLACAVTAIFKKCFTGDTLVATEDGYRRIDEIEVGDYVWAEDPLTGERALKKVLKVYVNETDTIIHIGTSSGEDIETTHNHPFYVEGKGWTAAAFLEEGDVLRTSDGTLVTVIYNYKEKLKEPIKVYNLEVEDFHTYYVTDEEVLVHNQCGVDGDGLKPSIDLTIDAKQLGKKWGKHKYDYPNLDDYTDYEHFAKDVFNNPDKIILDSANGEYLYVRGNDLLRIKLDGSFISIYPGANSDKVINALKRGGLLWEK